MAGINRRNIRIKRITDDDLAAVYRLGNETIAGCYRQCAHPWEPEYIAGIVSGDMSLSFAITSGKKLISFLIGRLIDDAGTPSGEILWFGIIRDFTHDAVGGMFESFLDAAKKRGAQKTAFLVPDQCSDIISILEKYGFTKKSSAIRYEHPL